MSHHSHHASHHEHKKDKKKRILMRNRRNQEIFRAMQILHASFEGLSAPAIEREETDEDRRKKKEDQVVWSAKTQDIRNRLNNSKRQAQERWNRFAGTDAAGAMGR